MFSAESHIRKIHTLERGAARLDALNTAIQEADAEDAHEWRIYFRYEYVEESIFHDDSYKAVIRFPELLAIFDEHPELDEDYYHDVMQAYKWVLENMKDYYQISREEIERFYADYEKRCRKYGYSLRVAHLKKCDFYIQIDLDLARQEFDAYHRCARDSSSDCAACEASQDMQFLLHFGREEEALRAARPLFEGKLRCGEVPHVTYGALTDYYLYKGDLAEASYYGARCERLIGNEPEFLDDMAVLLELNSAVNPSHGWRLFKQSLDNFLNCRNPKNSLCFAVGAYRLLSVIVDLTEDRSDLHSKSVLLRRLPVPADERGVSLEAVRDYFYGIAKEQSELLDRRNGSSFYADRLAAEIPKAVDASLLEQDDHQHGLVQRRPTMLAIVLPEGIHPTTKELEERIRSSVPEGLELVHAEGGDDLRFMVRREGRLYDIAVFLAEVREEIKARPVSGLTEEAYTVLQTNPQKYLFTMELGHNAAKDYAMMMGLISVLFPELVCLADLMTQHAYPASWVRFAGTYPDAVTPSDLFGLYLTGSDDSDEVWMTTVGLCGLGMRELEIIGADKKNYGIFADMLDHTAQQCVERGMLPDAGEQIAQAYNGEEARSFTWAKPEAYIREGSLAAEMQRDMPSAAVVVQTDDGERLPTEAGLFTEEPGYPSSNASFYRRLRLAKAAFGIFAEALRKPYERAAARVEFELDQETADQFGFGIELLWAEVSRIDGEHIYAALAEESEALPDLKKGDEIEISAENTAAWFVQPEGWRQPVTETNANMLEEA